MSNANDDDHKPLASSPCYAAETANSQYGNTQPNQKINITHWRKEERGRLLSARMKIRGELKKLAQEIAEEFKSCVDLKPGLTVSTYWPMRGELDLREMMRELVEQETCIALPVVIEKSQPMIFRKWTPDTPMERGVWNIPFPAEGAAITPDVVIAPLVGYDAECYRLGYGGGYFDRTLASFPTKPLVIGVGPPLCEIPTIYPQTHDIPMDMIITGKDRVNYRE